MKIFDTFKEKGQKEVRNIAFPNFNNTKPITCMLFYFIEQVDKSTNFERVVILFRNRNVIGKVKKKLKAILVDSPCQMITVRNL